jgi:hypothetical protein
MPECLRAQPLTEAFDWQASDPGVVAVTLSMAIVRVK